MEHFISADNTFLKFTVMWKNEKCADVIIDKDRNVSVKKYKDDKDVTKMPFGGSNTDIHRIADFFESRWYERARPDFDYLLTVIDSIDNIYEIVKKTHGVMFEDYIWVKFEGEDDLKWEDVRIRS